MTEVIKEVATSAPGVKILYGGASVRFEKSENNALIVPERFAVKAYPRETLFTEAYVCIVWAGNTLVGSALSPEQFLTLGHVVAYSERRTFVEEWFYHQFCEILKIAIVTPSYALVPPSVVGTNHIAVVPLRLARQSDDRLKLRHLKPPFDIPDMTDVLQWQTYQSEDLGLLWFRNVIKTTSRRLFL
jgi:LysR family nod box-dependent transcriptional activator